MVDENLGVIYLKKRKKAVDNTKLFRESKVEIENIGDLCTENMKIFGANNNLMRHIPSFNDGLKPGERRILYTFFHDLKNTPDKPKIKVAKGAGVVLGYHPHGDGPVKDTIVKMGRPWSNIQPLIEGEGNYGSPMGDVAADGRYIEARLSQYAWKCFFENFSPQLVDMKLTYGGDEYEPEYLPAIYPNVLINPTFGIGYGAACGVPTYNFDEVINLTLLLMDDPFYKDITLIPDSPTRADIVDEGNFTQISETGQGKFKMRGTIEVDEEENVLTITSIPMQTAADPIVSAIIDLFQTNKIQGIKKINNNSMYDENRMEAVIEVEIILKKEIDPYIVRSAIFTKTDMEKTYHVNFKLIDDYQDIDYNVRSLLLSWIDFRRETLRREYNYKLVKAKERQHVLEIILMVLAGKKAEETIAYMRKSKNKAASIEYLMKVFKISSLQARNIAEMSFSDLTEEAIQKFKNEKVKVDDNVIKYDTMVRSTKKLDKIIKNQLKEGAELFGYVDPETGATRRSKLITVDGAKVIRDTRHVVVFTAKGFVKKLPEDTQTIGFINQGDYPIEIIQVSNLSDLMIFDETGKISKLPINSLYNSEINSEGETLSKYCTIRGGIKAIIVKPTAEVLEKIKEPVYLVTLTQNGLVKKSLASSYVNIKGELLSMILNDDDQLQSVKVMVGDQDLLIYTSKGMGVRFNATEIKETNRMSKGVKAIELQDSEIVTGMDIINAKDTSIFVLTSKGTGKKCTLDNFKMMVRGDKPLRITNLEDNEDLILIKTVKGAERFRAYLTGSIEEIHIKEVPELPRLSKGRKLIPVPKGSRIIDIKEVK